MHLAFVELFAPLADNHRSDTVPDDISQSPRLRHKAVDAKNEGRTRDRHMSHGREGRGQNNETATGNPCRSLGGEQQYAQEGDLADKVELGVGRLRDELCSHCKVDRCAIEVERIPGRDHQADGSIFMPAPGLTTFTMISPTPSGFIASPVPGRKCPSRIPRMIAVITCT